MRDSQTEGKTSEGSAEDQRVGGSRLHRRRQQERRAESERRIIEAAINQIGQRGTQATTLADLGHEAGYSRGLAAHLFGSKEALLTRVAYDLMDMGLLALPTETGLDGLLHMISESLHIVKVDPRRGRAMHVMMSEALIGGMESERPALHAVMREIDRKARDHVVAFLDVAQKSDQIRSDVDTKAQAVIILGAMRGLMDQWFVSKGTLDLLSLGDALIVGVRHGLTCPAEAAAPRGAQIKRVTLSRAARFSRRSVRPSRDRMSQ